MTEPDETTEDEFPDTVDRIEDLPDDPPPTEEGDNALLEVPTERGDVA